MDNKQPTYADPAEPWAAKGRADAVREHASETEDDPVADSRAVAAADGRAVAAAAPDLPAPVPSRQQPENVFVRPDAAEETDERSLVSARAPPSGSESPPWLKTKSGKLKALLLAAVSLLAVILGIWWFWNGEGSSSGSSSSQDSETTGGKSGGGSVDGIVGPGSTIHRQSIDVTFTRMHLAGFDVALMTYSAQLPGPPMVVSPGSTFELTLTNKLPANRATPAALQAMNLTQRFAACWPPKPVGGPGGTAVPNGSLPSRRQRRRLREAEEHSKSSSSRGTAEARRARELQMSSMTSGGGGGHDGHYGSGKASSPLDYVNNPHAFRTTNMHTHGLQVPSTEDNPFLTIPPASGLSSQMKLTYHIPSNHPSGLFWYHPHTHGSAVVQLANGMAGVLKVIGSFDEAMTQRGYKEISLTVQQLDLVKLDAGSLADIARATGSSTSTSSSPVYGFDPAPHACAQDGGYTTGPFDLALMMVDGAVTGYSQPSMAEAAHPGTLGSGAEAHVLPDWTHTGHHPTHTIQYGEIMWLRVLNAHSRQPLVLGLDSISTSPVASSVDPAPYSSLSSALLASAFELYLVAVDGLSLAQPVKIELPRGGLPFAWGQDVENGVLLPPGGRYDLLLKAPSSSATAATAVNKAASDAVSSGKATSFEVGGVVGSGRPLPSSVTLWSHRYVGCNDKPDCHRYPPFRVATFVLPSASSSTTNAGSGARQLDKKKKKDDDNDNDENKAKSSPIPSSTPSPRPRYPMSLPSVLPAAATIRAAAAASPSGSGGAAGTSTPDPSRRLVHIEPSEVRRKRVFVLSQHMEPGAAYPSAEDMAKHAPANHNRDPLSLSQTGYWINNRTFDPQRVDFVATQGTAEEWWIENPAPAQDHPWHVHTNPFEVVGLYELEEDGEEDGESHNLLVQPYWADTLWVPEGMRAVTRIRFGGGPSYVGRTVAHCHIAEHESAGMMVQFDVVNP